MILLPCFPFVAITWEIILHIGLEMGKRGDPSKLPRIYYVNWFRKGSNGEWLWPGFGENIRVLKWIFNRLSDAGEAVKTPIGFLPSENALNLKGLQLAPGALQQLLHIDREEWIREAEEMEKYLKLFGSKLPHEISEELHQLRRD